MDLRKEYKRTLLLSRYWLTALFIVGAMYVDIRGLKAESNNPIAVLQEKTVKGSVADEGGFPLPGVNVVIKGTTQGAVTDINGNYTIRISDDNAVLVFSLIGYSTKEVVVGNQREINVILPERFTEIDEVVVTALGMKREKKALGYAMQEVKTDNLLDVKRESVANMLQGKVAGVQISQSATGINGSTRVIMRGMNSLTGNNQPLWVVDGIPIRDDSSADFYQWGGSDAAGTASEINPDDIAGISVLKGPNAAALYGSRAQNGVIVITTKSAGQEQPMSVTYNSNFSWSEIYGGYDYQWVYGQGNNGEFSISALDSWGPEMTGQMIPNWRNHFYGKDVADYAMTPQKNRIKDFFRTGFNTSNTVSIEGGGKNLASRFSFTDSRNQGITVGNTVERQYFDMNTNYKYSRLTVNLKATYSTQTLLNPVGLGEYGMMQMFNKMPSNIRTEDLKDNMTIDDVPMNWSGPSNEYINPYNYITDKKETNQKRNRLIAVLTANYRFTDWLGVTAKIGQDNVQNNNFSYGLKGSNLINPDYYRSIGNIKETNADAMLNINKTLNAFSVVSNIGAAVMNLKSDGINASSGPLILYGFNRLSNGSSIDASDYSTEKEIHSVLGNFQLGYNNYLYLDVTARNDWSSALPSQNRSYFYPSVSLSGILSDMLSLPAQVTFLKLRGSWAQVGNDTDPYRTLASYELGLINGNVRFADIGTVKSFNDLKPEQTTSVEFGFDFRMFRNRIGLDFTWYRSHTINQILSLAVPSSSGYVSRYINAGKMNSSGLEIMLNTTPVETKTLRWDLNLNYGSNRSECVELYESIPRHVLGSMRIGEVVVEDGGKYGDIRSRVFMKDDKGNILVDDNGIPIKSSEYETIGNISPKWTGSVTNRLQYKNFILNALVDVRYGGDLISVTDAIASASGTGARTLEGRDGMVVDGIVASTGQANTKQITAQQYWQAVGGSATGIGETFLYSGTYVKLRELSLAYQLPAQWLQKTKYIKKAGLSLVGRDLFYFLKETPGTDPEGASTRSDWAQGFEQNSLPSTRNIGFNISLTF
ncbi:MAG: SusC/RagA family TonB-linked outer membrane protein [Tannerellaceae bacterium]|jgi:TonB-linked SusC/RagA family outer membrane protein|nr:SusC/RagA family TonB-linked outer membrane protein [Tannerellaceae bacterium]